MQGPVNDITVKGNLFTGARNVNKNAVMELDKTVKGLKEVVVDYAEFVTPTPADKMEEEKPKQQGTTVSIPSPSK